MKVEPGVYFGMPEEEYHAIAAVGSSALRDMLIDPLTCWTRHVNPGRKLPVDTEATIRGRAYHALLLEGAAALADRFYPALEKEDGIAWSHDELKELARQHGEKLGGTKLDLALRLSAHVDEAILGPLVESTYAGRNGGKTEISLDDWEQLQLAADVMKDSGIANSFKGGAAEVVIVFDDEKTGLRCKARIDYLKPAAALDLKTFANKSGKELRKAVADAFIFNRNHVQAWQYWRAIETAKRLPLPSHGDQCGVCIHDHKSPHDYFIIFRQTGDVPNVVVRRFSQRSGGELNAYWRTAAAEVGIALREYRRCLDKFGTASPWIDGSAIDDFDDSDFPAYKIDL